MLTKSGKRMLILVDDLDRLDTDELMEVFKLVRNSVNFGNVIFLLAYDRGYLDQATAKRNEQAANIFLEKIVSVEFSLPMIYKNGLLKNLIDQILFIIDRSDIIDPIKKDVKGDVKRIFRGSLMKKNAKEIVNDLILNKRDVGRIINQMKVDLVGLLGEISIEDFILIQLLKLKYPTVHTILSNQPSIFLHENEKSVGYTSQFWYSLKKKDEVFVIQTHLADNYFKNNQISSIIGILINLFPEQYKSSSDKLALSVKIPRNFHLYFRNEIDSEDFSEKEYISFRDMGKNMFLDKISSWILEKKEFRLAERLLLEKQNPFETKKQFENVLSGIFHLASSKSVAYSKYTKYIGFEHPQLLYWCLDFDRKYSETLYDSKESLKFFIEELLKSGERCNYLFHSELVDRMKDIVIRTDLDSKKMLFSLRELEELNIHHLKSYYKNAKNYDQITEALLEYCRKINFDPPSGKKLRENTDGIILKEALLYLKNDLMTSQYENWVFSHLAITERNEQKHFCIKDTWKMFFSNSGKFISLVINEDNGQWKFKEEYAELLRSWFSKETDDRYITWAFSPEFIKTYDEFTKRFTVQNQY